MKGSDHMTSKRGRVKRKTASVSGLAEEPPLVINCVCPACDASISPKRIVGGYLNRRCPVCNHVIKPKDFDEHAARVLLDLKRTRKQVNSLAQELQQLKHKYERYSFILLRPFRRFVYKKLKHAQKEYSAARKTQHRLNIRLLAFARMRYYLSEWYFRTGFPLKRTVIAPFELKPCYDDNGVWRLPRGKKWISGTTAEFAVFQALYDEVTDPESVLYRAQIIPNIYLPRPLEYSRNGRSFWDQIDMVLLTTQAAFVIEVKRRHKNIIANAPFEDILSKALVWGEKRKSNDGSEIAKWDLKESNALSQNSRHAVAFDELVSQFPFERIYEQVVFVNPSSFESDADKFIDNVNVSCLAETSRFLLPVVSVCSELSPVITQEEVDRLGEMLVNQYGDLNQKRAIIHDNRIRNNRK